MGDTVNAVVTVVTTHGCARRRRKSLGSAVVDAHLGSLGEKNLSESSTVAAVRLHSQNSKSTVTIVRVSHAVNSKC
jgi:hypothetical protein